MIAQKKIDLDKGREVLTHLDEVPNPIISARQFVILNFDTLQQSGKTLKALYDFLTSREIDVGTFESFRADYNSVKRSRKTNPAGSSSSETILEKVEPEKSTKLEEAASAPSMFEKAKNENDVKKRPRGVGLRPLCLADGTEIEIDPNTGARIFQIRSNKNKEVQT
jgi:hypothetical protein